MKNIGNIVSGQENNEKVTQIRNAFNNIFYAIEKYDEQYSMGAMMADAVIGSMQNKEKPPKIKFKDVLQENEQYTQLVGLSIEPVKTENIKLYGAQNTEKGIESFEKSPREIRVNIGDHIKFLDSLSAFNKDNITELDAKNLSELANSLEMQIKNQYRLDDPDEDRLLEMFAGLSKMIDKYKELDTEKKLNLYDKAEHLEKYLETSRKGYLREFLAIETNNFLPIADEKLGNWKEAGFTLSNWQVDSSSDSYENYYWAKAFDALDYIKKNPNAQEFYHKILNYFKKCAIAGRKSITDRQKEYPVKIREELAEDEKNPAIHRLEKDPEKLTDQMNKGTELLLKALDRIEEKLNNYN